MTACFLRRIGAYLIDIILILILSNIISSFLPNNTKISSLNQNEMQVWTEYFETISENDIDIDFYKQEINDYTYKVSKLSIYSNFTVIVLYFLYFICFQSYNNGQTLGKKLFKIEIVDKENNELKFKQILIRGLILYPIVLNLLTITSILIFKQSIYEVISTVLSCAKYLIFILCCLPVLFKGRGLHDYLAGTIVIVEGTLSEETESNASKWKKKSAQEKEIKKYRVNHTSDTRKEKQKNE